jgi:hypothetical protein
MTQSPIFTKTYDLLQWLIPATVKFPRQHRFVLADTLQQSGLQFQKQIIAAVMSDNPRPLLEQADITLAQLRIHLRLAHDLGLFSKGQYRHAAGMVNEIGKLLGGWFKTV